MIGINQHLHRAFSFSLRPVGKAASLMPPQALIRANGDSATDTPQLLECTLLERMQMDSPLLKSTHDIVVIGGSAGAFEPLRTLLAELPADLPATLFIVLHRPAQSGGMLADVLCRGSKLQVKPAVDGERPVRGIAYIAPPDQHLVLKPDGLRLTKGPRENQWRPAIDVLFRSAAVAFGSRVAGVILSGALDDGTAGVSAIKRCGGVAIVQSPADSAFEEMPAFAIRNTSVDHVIPAKEIASVIQRIVKQPADPSVEIPQELVLEASIAEAGLTPLEQQNQLGELTPLTCADCGGPLWKQHFDGLRFRCMTGHALSARTLETGLNQNLDAALWAAIRQFEQRANLQREMAQEEEKSGRRQVASNYRERASEAKLHAEELRKLLLLTADRAAGADT
jgi:two-component system chemotaxis response regulator CheB